MLTVHVDHVRWNHHRPLVLHEACHIARRFEGSTMAESAHSATCIGQTTRRALIQFRLLVATGSTGQQSDTCKVICGMASQWGCLKLHCRCRTVRVISFGVYCHGNEQRDKKITCSIDLLTPPLSTKERPRPWLNMQSVVRNSTLLLWRDGIPEGVEPQCTPWIMQHV